MRSDWKNNQFLGDRNGMPWRRWRRRWRWWRWRNKWERRKIVAHASANTLARRTIWKFRNLKSRKILIIFFPRVATKSLKLSSQNFHWPKMKLSFSISLSEWHTLSVRKFSFFSFSSNQKWIGSNVRIESIYFSFFTHSLTHTIHYIGYSWTGISLKVFFNFFKSSLIKTVRFVTQNIQKWIRWLM